MSTEVTQKRKYYQLHRWVGLIAGFLGILVFGSGAVATFHHELGAWAHRGNHVRPVFDYGDFSFDEALVAAGQGVDDRFRHAIDIFQGGPHPVGFFFHAHDKSPSGQVTERGVFAEYDPRTKKVVHRKEGSNEEVFEPNALASLSAFFVELHILLLMPRTMGLVATGLVGFALLILIATGYLVHRPSPRRTHGLPKDQARRNYYGKLHTWVGSWTLPYTVVLALTGTFFSFAGAVLIPVVALVAFGGDQEELIRTAIGKIEVPASDEIARLDVIIADARARLPHADFQGMTLDAWGEPNANATLRLVEHGTLGDRNIQLVYDGHTGAFMMEKPSLGTKPSVGNSLLLLMGYLHFGTLFGTLTKVLWGLFGLATCVLAASGLVIFGVRQEQAGTKWVPAMRFAIASIAGGMPLAFAGTALAWSIGLALGFNPAPVLPWVFAMLTIVVGVRAPSMPLRLAIVRSWAASALILLVLPLANVLATGVRPGDLWTEPSIRGTVAVDLVLIALGAAFVAAARWLSASRKNEDERVAQPTATATSTVLAFSND